MDDLFQSAKVETSADTRARAVAALGFDEPGVTGKLSRSDFGSDEEYFHACARLAVQNHDPAYRAEYTRIRREFNAKKAEEAETAAEQQHKKEIEEAIRTCVLRPEEQQKIDDESRRRAQADLAAGRISFQQLGATVADYAVKLTADFKRDKVHHADFNAQLRAAMSKVISKK